MADADVGKKAEEVIRGVSADIGRHMTALNETVKKLKQSLPMPEGLSFEDFQALPARKQLAYAETHVAEFIEMARNADSDEIGEMSEIFTKWKDGLGQQQQAWHTASGAAIRAFRAFDTLTATFTEKLGAVNRLLVIGHQSHSNSTEALRRQNESLIEEVGRLKAENHHLNQALTAKASESAHPSPKEGEPKPAATEAEGATVPAQAQKPKESAEMLSKRLMVAVGHVEAAKAMTANLQETVIQQRVIIHDLELKITKMSAEAIAQAEAALARPKSPEVQFQFGSTAMSMSPRRRGPSQSRSVEPGLPREQSLARLGQGDGAFPRNEALEKINYDRFIQHPDQITKERTVEYQDAVLGIDDPSTELLGVELRRKLPLTVKFVVHPAKSGRLMDSRITHIMFSVLNNFMEKYAEEVLSHFDFEATTTDLDMKTLLVTMMEQINKFYDGHKIKPKMVHSEAIANFLVLEPVTRRAMTHAWPACRAFITNSVVFEVTKSLFNYPSSLSTLDGLLLVSDRSPTVLAETITVQEAYTVAARAWTTATLLDRKLNHDLLDLQSALRWGTEPMLTNISLTLKPVSGPLPKWALPPPKEKK